MKLIKSRMILIVGFVVTVTGAKGDWHTSSVLLEYKIIFVNK